MGVRIDPEGYAGLTDAVASGNMSSGATLYEDGRRPPPWETGPWAGRQEYIASEALQLASVPADTIRKIRPIVPQRLFPDEKVGFDRTPLTVEDALSTDRWSPTVRSWVSGSVRQIRRDLEDDMWGGTMRNVSPTSNPMM